MLECFTLITRPVGEPVRVEDPHEDPHRVRDRQAARPAARFRPYILLGSLALAACATASPSPTGPRLHLDDMRPTLVLAATPELPRGLGLPPWRSDAAAGRTMFQQRCAECHGSGGAGDGPAAVLLRQGLPDLSDVDRMRAAVPSWLQRSIWDGTGAMPSWSHVLSRQESWDLTFYVWSLSLAPAAGDAGRYGEHCSSCHGPLLVRGPGPRPPGLNSAVRAARSFQDEARWLSGGPALGLPGLENIGSHPRLPTLDPHELEGALRYAWTFLYEPLPAVEP